MRNEIVDNRWKIFFDNSPSASFLINKKGKCMDANLAAQSLVSLTEKDIKTKYFSDLMSLESIQENDSFLSHVIGSKKSSIEIELRIGNESNQRIALDTIKLSDNEYLINCSKIPLDEKSNHKDSRYYSLFESSPVAIWEEDFSEVKKYIDTLKKQNISDFTKYFDENPDAVLECTQLVKILDVNKQVVELHEAESKEILLSNMSDLFIPESFDTFKKELVAISENKPSSEFDTKLKTVNGKIKDIHLKYNIAPGSEPTLDRIYVSMVDITKRKQTELALKDLVESTSSLQGQGFFDSVIMQLSSVLDADAVFIGEFKKEDPKAVKTKTVASHGKLLDNFEYELGLSPCASIIAGKICSYSSGVADLFPNDALLIEKGIEAYIGIPLIDSKGNSIGILVSLFKQPIFEIEFKETFLNTFSIRITSELERLYYDEILLANQNRYYSLFESSPIPLWEEDFSKVKTHIDSLKKRKIKNFKKYFDEHPDVVRKCIDLIEVIGVNKAAAQLVGAASVDELIGKITLETPESFETFKEELVAIAENKTSFEFETTYKSNNKLVHLLMNFSVAPDCISTYERVYLSMQDISNSKQTELALKDLVVSTSSHLGQDFFDSVILQLSLTLNSDCVFIGQVNDNPVKSIMTIATASQGKKIDNFEYELGMTPCENVFGKEICCYTSGVADLFSEDATLKEMGIEAYVGIPLFDSKQNSLGILVALFKQPIHDIKFKEAFLHTFSLRISSELERLNYDHSIIKNELRYHSLFESSPVAMWEEDFSKVKIYLDALKKKKIRNYKKYFDDNPDTVDKCADLVVVVDVNRRALELAGATSFNELTGQLHLRTPERHESFKKQLIAIVENKFRNEFDTVVQAMNGDLIHVLLSFSIAPGFESTLERVYVSMLDITSRKQIGNALKESENMFSSFTNQSIEGVSVADFDGNYTFVNPAFCEMVGWSQEELLTMTVFDVTADKQDTATFQKTKSNLEGTPVYVNLIRKDQTEFIAEIIGKNVVVNGKSRTMGLVRDVTERNEYELLLKEKDFIISSASNSITTASLDGMMTYANQEFMNIWGFDTLDQIIQRPFNEFWNLEGRDDEMMSALLGKQKKWFGESIGIKKDGTFFSCLIYAATVVDDFGKPISLMATSIDITEQKQAEKALKESEQFFDNLFNLSPVGVSVISFQEKIIKINRTFIEMFGYSQNNITNLDDWFVKAYPDENYRKEVLDRWSEEMKNVLDGSLSLSSSVYNVTCKDGSIKHVDIRLKNNSKNFLVSFLDVTERYIADKALKESEQFFDNLFNLSPVGVSVISFQEKIIKINQTFSDMFGYTLEEIPTTEDWFSAAYPDAQYRKGIKDNWNKNVVNSKNEIVAVPSNIYSITCKDGSIKHVDIGVKNNSKNFLVSFLDVTDRTIAERALKASEQFFDNVFTSSPVGIVVTDFEGKVLKLNQTFVDMFGYSLNDFTTVDEWSKFAYLDDEYRQKALNNWGSDLLKAENNELDVTSHVYTIACKNGDVKKIDVIKKRTKDNLLISFVDVTERHIVEEALKASEYLLRESQKVASIGSYNLEFESGYWESSDALNQIFGIDESFEKNIDGLMSIVHPDDLAMMEDYFSNHIFKKQKSFNKEYRIIKKNNQQACWVHGLGKLEFDNKGNLVEMIGTIQEITQRKKSEEELQKMQKLQTLGTLAGGIAHDFNNILTGIFAYISLVKDEFKEEQQGFKNLESAEKAVEMAKSLTNQLLTFSKGGEPIKEGVHISNLIEEVVRFDLTGSNIKPVFMQSKNLWIADIDKGQIQQVFSNLTINAKQAMPDGGHLFVSLENIIISDSSSINLKVGKYIVVTVRDEGVGISEDNINKIFDPYFSTKTTGSGLGLATTYSIMKKHGGSISVESVIGKGTIFSVYLPSSESLEIKEPKVKNMESSTLKKPAVRILVMDDVKMLRDIMKLILVGIGYEVDVSEDGDQAIELYQKSIDDGSPYDVVIMDLTIPGGMGGKEAIVDIIKLNPKVKGIVTSGYADDPVMANYSDYGFHGVIPKPFNKDDMMKALLDVMKD